MGIIQKERFQLESSDADEISALMSRAFAPMKIDSGRLFGPVSLDMQSMQLGKLSLTKAVVSGRMGAGLSFKHPQHCIILPISGFLGVSAGAKEYTASGATVCTYAAGTNRALASSNVEFIGIEIAPDTLAAALSAYMGGAPSAPFEFKNAFELPLADIKSLRAIAEGLLACEMDADLLTRSPIAAAYAVDMLVAFAIELFPNTYSDRLHDPRTRIAPRHVKRAIEHMHENIRNPITMPELAKVSGVSLRSLQYGFNNFAGMPPLAYLQNLRLAEACKEIQSGSSTSTVAEIAVRWGFTNPGRFSVLCQKAFGKKPAELRR